MPAQVTGQYASAEPGSTDARGVFGTKPGKLSVVAPTTVWRSALPSIAVGTTLSEQAWQL